MPVNDGVNELIDAGTIDISCEVSQLALLFLLFDIVHVACDWLREMYHEMDIGGPRGGFPSEQRQERLWHPASPPGVFDPASLPHPPGEGRDCPPDCVLKYQLRAGVVAEVAAAERAGWAFPSCSDVWRDLNRGCTRTLASRYSLYLDAATALYPSGHV